MLQRETLKWLQSLEITRVCNPKRDFANGVLIADIFGKYFPGQLNTDLFYVGSGMEQKRNNWDQLQKFFQRNEIYIPPEAIDAVMTCQPDAAVLFVENVHMLLTNRRAYPKIHRTERDLFDASVPHFALPTASDLIRTAAVKPEKADAIVREYKLRMKGVKRAGVSFKDARILKEPKVHVGVPNLPHSASTRMSSASTGTATVANVSSIEIVQRSL